MVLRKRVAALCAATFLTVGASAWSAPSESPTTLTLDQPLLLDDAPTTAPAPERQGLMELLSKTPAGNWLEQNNIKLYGYAAGAYTYNFSTPDDDTNVGRVFDFETDKSPRLSQLDFTVERTVDVSKKQFDIGGRVEWIWGADAGLIHSNGLFDWHNGPRKPENQLDLNQAYLDFALPVGNGLLIRAGKFVTLLGQEVINPTGNALYSHSYLFGFAIPFTHTGVLASYAINDNWSFTAGITRGWEQSLEDNNGSIDFLGQVKWVVNKQWTAIANVVVGPERADNDSDYRLVLDGVVTFVPNDKWTFVANGDFGWEQGAASKGDDAYWYGIAGYATYAICDYASVTGRLEWFRDDGGTRIISGTAANYYEATLGVNVHPFAKDRWGKYLVVRPEIREDWSSDNVFNVGKDDNQFTIGVDVYYTF